MKISMFKFYKYSIIFFISSGLFVIFGSIILTIYYYRGVGIDDFIMLFLAVPTGIGTSLLPVILYYKLLTHISLDHEKCISYSLLGKQLCSTNYNTTVYYSFFDVKWTYEPVRFIAISNIILNLVLINLYGINGAALALTLTQFLTNFAYVYLLPQTRESAKLMLDGIILKGVLK